MIHHYSLLLNIYTAVSFSIAQQRPNSWMKSRQKSSEFSSFLFIVTSTDLPCDFYFFELKRPLTVSRVLLLYTVKEKEENLIKTIPPSLGLKKSTQKQKKVWELSRLCPETSTKLYFMYELGSYYWCLRKGIGSNPSRKLVNCNCKTWSSSSTWQIMQHWQVSPLPTSDQNWQPYKLMFLTHFQYTKYIVLLALTNHKENLSLLQ